MKNDDREVCSKTAPKSTKNTKVCYKNLDDSDDEQELLLPAVKHPQKASKTSGADDEDPQKTSPGPVHKEPAKPAKNLLAASCSYILTSGIRKGKQSRLKASDKTGKFYKYHKSQTRD